MSGQLILIIGAGAVFAAIALAVLTLASASVARSGVARALETIDTVYAPGSASAAEERLGDRLRPAVAQVSALGRLLTPKGPRLACSGGSTTPATRWPGRRSGSSRCRASAWSSWPSSAGRSASRSASAPAGCSCRCSPVARSASGRPSWSSTTWAYAASSRSAASCPTRWTC
ncbi:hypothetical protein ACFQZ4_25595 [Catellatospora coxensis]